MGFQDRHYYQQREPTQFGGGFGGGGMGGWGKLGLPKPTHVVKYLLIINFVVYLLQLIFRALADQNGMGLGLIEQWFAAISSRPFEIWRLIGFQFLHGGPFHLFFNMLGLYFLGPYLEQKWGGRKFLIFYLSCGAVGGLIFVIASNISLIDGGVLVGASGGVLGIIAGCAILFPQIMIIMIFFPLPIRTAAIILTVGYLLIVISSGPNAGGNLCHLGGMATAAVWVMGRGSFSSLWFKKQQGAFQRKLEQEAKLQYELDRILAKVHEQGMQSLTRKEQETLRRATKEQKKM